MPEPDPRRPAAPWLLLAWLLLVALPLATAALAALWIELCRALYIPGAFLAIPAYVAQIGVALYAAPVRWLFGDRLCFLAGENVIADGLPCDASTWLAVAACYTLSVVVPGAALRRLRTARQ